MMAILKRMSRRGVRYVAVVDVGRDANGKRIQRKKTFATRKEAEAYERQVRAALDRGAYVHPARQTLGEYLAQWLASCLDLRPSSRLRYEQAVRHLCAGLGTVPLAKLTSLQIQRWYTSQLDAGMHPATLRLEHAVLHRALRQAVQWHLLGANPCDAVEPPRAAQPELRVWTADEARAFLAACAQHELGALFHCALISGMRVGELLALAWSGVDFAKQHLTVTRTLVRTKGGWMVGEPKSRAGKRTIALPASTIAVLREHRRRQNERRLARGAAWHDLGLVFDRGDGGLCDLTSVSRAFQRLVARLGLPPIRFHDLRHTCATLLLADGVNPKVVQERLGHSTVTMTLQRYAHVTESMQRDAAARLEQLFASV